MPKTEPGSKNILTKHTIATISEQIKNDFNISLRVNLLFIIYQFKGGFPHPVFKL